jgi:hypothetical protein
MSNNHTSVESWVDFNSYRRGYCDAVLRDQPLEPDNKSYMEGWEQALETGKKWDG